jgi:CRP-like cAMP-binding protein
MAGAFRATSIFATLTDEQIAELAEASRPLLFGASEAIVRQGDEGSSMFVVCGGRAEVRVPGSATCVAVLEAGDYFGEMSLLTGERRTATVIAAVDCRVIEIAADDFRRLVHHDPSIVERVTDVMTRRRAELDDHRATVAVPQERSDSPRTFLTAVRRFLGLAVAP